MRISTQKKLLKKYALVIPLIILFISLVYSQKDKDISSEEVIRRVGEVYVLPVDEKPTVATVTNLEPLKDNLFFKNAEVGDKVIIYAREGKVILFRLSDNKVVEVGPINIKKDEI